MKKLKKLFIVGAIFAMPTAAFAQVISNAELSATTCFMCHGPEGKNVGGAIPALAGYPAEVMAQQLKAYKSGERKGTIMNRHILGYTDEEIDEIAQYFSTLKP